MSGEQVAPSAVAEMRTRAEEHLSITEAGGVTDHGHAAAFARDVLALTDALAAVTAERDRLRRVKGEAEELLGIEGAGGSAAGLVPAIYNLVAERDEWREAAKMHDAQSATAHRRAEAAKADRDRLAGQVAALLSKLEEIADLAAVTYPDYFQAFYAAIKLAREAVLGKTPQEMCPCGTPHECIPGTPGCVVGETPQEEAPEEARSATAETREGGGA